MGTMRGVRRAILLGLAGVLATLSLAGCALFGIASPGLYDHVDSLAIELDLSSVGTVQYQGHYGLGWASDIPTYIAIVSSPNASTRISRELRDSGLKPLGAEADSRTLWTKGDGDTYYQVVVREVKPGDQVLVEDKLIRVKKSGIAISIE